MNQSKKIILMLITSIILIVSTFVVTNISYAISDDFAIKGSSFEQKSVAGIFTAMKNNHGSSKWVESTIPNQLDKWNPESGIGSSTGGTGAEMIYRWGALCFGHQRESGTGLKKLTIFDVDPDITVNGSKETDADKLKLSYYIYKSTHNESQIKGTGGVLDYATKALIYNWIIKNSGITVQELSAGEEITSVSGMDDYKTNASNYAAKIKNAELKTNSTITSSQKIEIKDGNTFIGPYNLQTKSGTLKTAKINNSIDTKWCSKNGKDIIEMKDLGDYNGNNFYIVVKEKSISSVDKIVISKEYKYYISRIVLAKAHGGGGQDVAVYDAYEKSKKVNLELPGIPYSKITITKQEADTKENLANVGIILYNETEKKYVVSGNPATYVSDIKDAEVFKTDSKGRIEIDYVSKTGKYIVYEVINPNMAYKECTLQNPIKLYEFTLTSIGTDISRTVYNKKEYMKLRGYVWEDMSYSKNSKTNALYDVYDKRVNNVLVVLKDTAGNQIDYQTTKEDGSYAFNKVKIADLINGAYIEFYYNGMCYQSVPKNIEKTNGSKAEEKTREAFNSRYTEIKNNLATASNGDTFELKYEKADYKSELYYRNDEDKSEYKYGYSGQRYPVYGIDKQYSITAITGKAKDGNNLLGLNISYDDIYGKKTTGTNMPEIENINLGLYEREQPDLSVVKDIENAKVMVNGYEHTYEYAKRFQDEEYYIDEYFKKKSADGKHYKKDENNIYVEDNDGEYMLDKNGKYIWLKDIFNIGVRFETGYYNNPYTREVYSSDIKSQDSQEFNVKVTYKITIRNESSSLKTKVNSLVDYYDKNYTLISVGTKLDDSKNVIDNPDIIKKEPPKYSSKEYNKVELLLKDNEKIDAGKDKVIYMQFEIDKSKVYSILYDAGGKEIESPSELKNIVEINSYSVFDESEKVYAGIDKDSQPGNAVPGDINTYEDDTDLALGLQLRLTGARTITGKVFLDYTSNELMTGEERKADGIYDKNREEGISNVIVTMKGSEDENINLSYTTGTNEQGEFTISNFVPGKYDIVYNWGGKEYILSNGNKLNINVKDYKGTIFNARNEIYNDHGEQTNFVWYKDFEPRNSDAMDDYNLRKAIDNETEKITSMYSTTPTMEFGVELGDIAGNINLTSVTDENKIKFEIPNIDFGIAERPRQQIDISKKVKTVKITLANGQTIVDAEVIIVKGDVNGDAIINVKDATIIRQYIFNEVTLTEEQKLKADVDGDGIITIKDASEINKYLNGTKEVEYELKGETKGVTYMGPSKDNIPKNGYLKSEIDSELIQGSTIEIGYEIIVKNNSEVDYDSETYYKYGVLSSGESPEDKIITITPTRVYDYLDKSMVMDKNDTKNNGWTTIEDSNKINTTTDSTTTVPTILENYLYYESSQKQEDKTIKITGYESSYEEFYSEIEEWSTETIKTARQKRLADKTILHNAQLERKLTPGQSNTANLYVTKMLANNDEIDLNNDVEITQIERTTKTGRKVTPTSSTFYDKGETVTVTPATGENRDYTSIIVLVISSFIILGTGIVFIKKKILR